MLPARSADGLYIGVMSGTSLDGADAVLAEFITSANASRSGSVLDHVLGHVHAGFSDALRGELLALQQPGAQELQRAALAANALCDHYAGLIEQLLNQCGVKPTDIIAIGAHGQTVRHRPELGYTLQLNNAARLAEACGIDVIADFRSRDVAAGGQGAPLVPAFHADVFGGSDRHRVVVNIGGIANITDLPVDPGLPVRGWDTGPGNGLLDAWIQRRRDMAFDNHGKWAASGQTDAGLLKTLCSEPWFQLPPPKSTGRDLFNTDWLDRCLNHHGDLRGEDVQATLAELTASCIADAVARHCASLGELIVCGGGAFNDDLLARLARLLNQQRAGGLSVEVVTSDQRGLPPDQVEALAFAWLAQRFLAGLPGNLPAVTGARGLRILGAHYPR